MDDLSVILNGLEYKTIQLIKKLEQLEKENDEIKSELKRLQNTEHETKIQITKLEEKNNILKIANSIEGEENKTKVKFKINELLREVERCLALLNK